MTQISRIAEVLAEIADNIHLLALNATIEAAGAGITGGALLSSPARCKTWPTAPGKPARRCRAR